MFYLYDGLGSVRGLSNVASLLTDTFDYFAFGELANRTGSTENNYLFTGEEFDQNLGHYYLRNRRYAPEVGRLTQMDDWMGYSEEPHTLNKYSYAFNDPTNVIDPSGNVGLLQVSTVSRTLGVLSTTALPSYSSFLVNATNATVSFGVLSLLRDINLFSEIDATIQQSVHEGEPLTEAEEAEKDREYQHAKDFCDNQKPDPGRNDCATLSRLIEHTEQCIALYEAWDNKWLKDRHDDKIRTWKNRLQNLKDEHKRKCTNK